ncbi:hypothetical protein HU200_020194 [Digitaria exilis]|uniref:Uncharacterized protein n=1 Tax=Digitaria exilis TaxID=1010633 RepID=A0A835F1R7_9POAL|nr:hypothetical protein HU200_020194 [Digitaria exilis]
MPELAEFWVEVVWLGSRWWPSNNGVAATESFFAGSPVLSRAARAFRNAAVVAACKVAAEDAFHCFTTAGGVSKHKLDRSVSASTSMIGRTSTAAGVYVAMESTVEEIRGRTDWKNAVIGGALAGAVMSAATAGRRSHRDKVVKDAIAGAAIAAAVEFIGHRIRVDLGTVRFGGTIRKGIGQTREEDQTGGEPCGERQGVDPWVMGRGEELPLQIRTTTDSEFHREEGTSLSFRGARV